MRLTLDRRNYDADFDREAYVEQITKEFWDPTGNPVDAQPYPDVWLRMVRRRTADGGVITVFADISDLKRAEQRLRDAIEALAEGFALYDRDGYLVMANTRFYALTGHDPAVVREIGRESCRERVCLYV